MSNTPAPPARSKFAKRLKGMRQLAGFERARCFANALGIEENRYTRYERAEVEPSLTLLEKMCDVLRVSPNHLMGFAETGGRNRQQSALQKDAIWGSFRADGSDVQPLRNLAWRLAGKAAEATRRSSPPSHGADDPLVLPRDTAKLFLALDRDPFGTVASIAADQALQVLDADAKAELAELIKAYTHAITRS